MLDEMAKTLARRRAAVERKEPENPTVMYTFRWGRIKSCGHRIRKIVMKARYWFRDAGDDFDLQNWVQSRAKDHQILM